MRNLRNRILKAIIRQEISTRGGGVEIDLKKFGFKQGSKMAAYQNYLGGGLLGAVRSNYQVVRKDPYQSLTEEQVTKLEKIAEELRKYFHERTNPDTEWEGSSYEENQRRPAAAY